MFRIVFIVNIVLMCDGDKRSGGGVNSKIEISAYVGVVACYNLDVMFVGDFCDVGIRCGGGN